MSKWITIEAGCLMPDSTDTVLMIIDGKPLTGHIYSENWYSDPFHSCMDSNGHWRSTQATHWKKITLPPRFRNENRLSGGMH